MASDWLINALNSPFGDPGFILRHRHLGSALFFDLGELAHHAPRELLKPTLIFISHAHIDHLIGFDHLLRLNLNRCRHLHFFGPPDLSYIIGNKLGGFLWNLTAHYELLISVTEIHPEYLQTTDFACREKFCPRPQPRRNRPAATIWQGPHFSIQAACLDHGTPCLAYILEEPQKIAFRPEKLKEMNLPPGPWLTEMRNLLLSGAAPDSRIKVGSKKFALATLTHEIAHLKPGAKISYVTDAAFSDINLKKLLAAGEHSDLLICEAAFLAKATAKAAASQHLTAAQAGRLATAIKAKRLALFHFSPRHHHEESNFYNEAALFFSGPVFSIPQS